MLKLTEDQLLLIQQFIEENYDKVENAYVEDCFFENDDYCDGRYEYILIPKNRDKDYRMKPINQT